MNYAHVGEKKSLGLKHKLILLGISFFIPA